MSELDRVVGGISCRDVLGDLSDYLDGALSEERVREIETHLQGCDRCEQFGGRFSRVVGALRERLATPEPLPSSVARRLKDRLEAEIPE